VRTLHTPFCSERAEEFHFSNAPMLPLVVQKLALGNPGWETGLTSAAIIIAQFVMILMALLVTRAEAASGSSLSPRFRCAAASAPDCCSKSSACQRRRRMRDPLWVLRGTLVRKCSG
jgi:hypothetical protein